jgi:hypothetical protein
MIKKLLLALTFILATAAWADVYEGQIEGEYHGWSGDTVYKLMDGYIIEQRTYHYHYHYAYSPKVLIYGSPGNYKVRVEGDDDDPIEINVYR